MANGGSRNRYQLSAVSDELREGLFSPCADSYAESFQIMRIVVVGAARARARLARQLPEVMEIVGEARTIAEARDAGLAAEAYLVASSGSTDDADLAEALTPREIEVVELLAQGLPNKAIAARLGISDQTVKFHVGAICGKLGAANRTEAAHRALQLGVIPL